MGKKCDLLLECVCTGNAAQAEIEKSGFLHYAAAQPEPIVAVGALLARLAEKLDEYGQSFWEICPEKEDLAAELRGLHTVAELSLWLRGCLLYTSPSPRDA